MHVLFQNEFITYGQSQACLRRTNKRSGWSIRSGFLCWTYGKLFILVNCSLYWLEIRGIIDENLNIKKLCSVKVPLFFTWTVGDLKTLIQLKNYDILLKNWMVKQSFLFLESFEICSLRFHSQIFEFFYILSSNEIYSVWMNTVHKHAKGVIKIVRSLTHSYNEHLVWFVITKFVISDSHCVFLEERF